MPDYYFFYLQTSDAGEILTFQVFQLSSFYRTKMIEKPLATITEAEAIQYDRQVTFIRHFIFSLLPLDG